MRTIFNRHEREKSESGLFSKKAYILKRVQEEFSLDIRSRLMNINNKLDYELKSLGSRLDGDIAEFIYSELTSNLLELELNINTIIMNFSRITGIRIKFVDKAISKKTNILRRGKIFILLDQDTSEVYGQTLLYLEEEMKRELLALEMDIDRLILSFRNNEDALEIAQSINQEYFKINSDMNTIIDDINSAIENIYSNIYSNRDMHINLSFLLISAFLSIVLFFPEFNNMLNLRDQELTYEDKLDEMIYEKTLDEVKLEELLDIKDNRKSEDILEDIDDEILKEIIRTNIDYENEKLEKEKNRIKIFVGILVLIMIPFLTWIIFIVL